MEYSYPHDLAEFVLHRWKDQGEGQHRPPDRVVEQLLSTCYQASLFHEEQRRVTFRVMACLPQLLNVDDGPPTGLHRLVFSPPRLFDEQELRRIALAAEFHRSLLGVRWQRQGRLEIWGLVHSGPRWLQAAHGGRMAPAPMPPTLVICVKGPGQLTVCQGNTTLAMLNGGRITCPDLDVFDSAWLPGLFADSRRQLREEYIDRFGAPTSGKPDVIENLARLLAQHVVRRITSLVRSRRHGGTVLIVSPETSQKLLVQNTNLQIKYRFLDEEPRRRFRTLLFRLLHRLQAIHAEGDGDAWELFLSTNDGLVQQLDEGIFELAHLVASLAAVDGAVLMSDRFEILGFGAEISGALPEVERFRLCDDAEGTTSVEHPTDGLGTRHRSAFRFCQRFPGSLAIIVSQDGNIRFATVQHGSVHCWDHVSASFLDV